MPNRVNSEETARSCVFRIKPFLVLRKLLESGGAVVAREDLHAALWPADTFVDFDTSLNSAIKRLREVLGDSADTPVFIETIPRRGTVSSPRFKLFGMAARRPFSFQLTLIRLPLHGCRSRLIVAALFLALVAAGVLLLARSPVAVPRVLDSTQITFDQIGKGNLHLHDGKIYFNEQASDRVTLLEVPSVGGIPVVLAPSYPGLFLRGVSADGSKFLVSSADIMKGALSTEDHGFAIRIFAKCRWDSV